MFMLVEYGDHTVYNTKHDYFILSIDSDYEKIEDDYLLIIKSKDCLKNKLVILEIDDDKLKYHEEFVNNTTNHYFNNGFYNERILKINN